MARRDKKVFFSDQCKEIEENYRLGKDRDLFQRRQWHPTPVLLPGKFHRWRSLVGYSPWSHKESDTTERLHFLSFFITEPPGKPLDLLILVIFNIFSCVCWLSAYLLWKSVYSDLPTFLILFILLWGIAD